MVTTTTKILEHLHVCFRRCDLARAAALFGRNLVLDRYSELLFEGLDFG